MIDNAALLIFGSLIVYTVYRAIALDKTIPWFSSGEEGKQLKKQEAKPKSALYK